MTAPRNRRIEIGGPCGLRFAFAGISFQITIRTRTRYAFRDLGAGDDGSAPRGSVGIVFDRLPGPAFDRLSRAVASGGPGCGEAARILAGEFGPEPSRAFGLTADRRTDTLTLWDFDRAASLALTNGDRVPEDLDTVLTLNPGIVSPFTPLFSTLLIHSSAVVLDGRGVLMVAPDEGGKTTAVLSGHGGRILSDDCNAVSIEGDRPLVHPTGWSLLEPDGGPAPLGAVLFLEKADAFSLCRIDSGEAIRRLHEGCWCRHDDLPPAVAIEAAGLARRLALSVPCATAGLTLEGPDWSAVRSLLGDAG